MEKSKTTTLRIAGAILLVLGAVIWAVVGMLLVAASARSSRPGAQVWTIILIVIWLGGLAGAIGGAVRLVRPILQQASARLEKPGRKRL
jgi:hypothetical protein